MKFFTPCFLRLFFNEFTKGSTGINACHLFILWKSLAFQLNMKEPSEWQKNKALFTCNVKHSSKLPSIVSIVKECSRVTKFRRSPKLLLCFRGKNFDVNGFTTYFSLINGHLHLLPCNPFFNGENNSRNFVTYVRPLMDMMTLHVNTIKSESG